MTGNSSPRYKRFLTVIALIAVLAAAAPARAQAPVPSFTKVFLPGTVGPGSVATLRFDIVNDDAAPVSDLAFTDVLPAGVVIASPSNALSFCGGVVDAPDGGGTITFSDGLLGASSACSLFVDVTSSTPGTHMNTSGDLTSSVGNSGAASADLTVAATLPGFSKSFAPSSVPLGGRSTLTLTVDNTANAAAVSNLDFIDTLPVGMVIADPANASSTCGTATIPAIVTAVPGTSAIILDANGVVSFPAVAAGATCTVVADVVGGAVGPLGNTSGDLLADLVSCGRASAVLDVTASMISLIKEFTDDPVPPGGTATLELTVTNLDRDNPATGISFSDDLGAVLAGLTFSSLLSNDCGGSVSGVGTTTITMIGGTLAPQNSCTVSTSLSVPAGAPFGTYTNTTGAVSATVGGSPVTGNTATDVLFVAAAPALTKEFTDDPVGAGGNVNLRFTINNTSLVGGITDIEFIDDLTVFLPFPVSVVLPATPCGAGSSMSLISLGTDRQGLELTGGNLATSGTPGDSCTFEVTVSVPVGFPSGFYTNTTGNVTATVGGTTVTGPPASDVLQVVAAPRLVKEFTDDPVDPGATVTLEFTLTHDPDAPADATAITFTDDLAPVLAGLTATLPPSPDPPCGVGSSLTGSNGGTLLTFSGGTLAPAEVCTFSVTLNVPGGAAPGSYTNATSDLAATVLGVTATENGASDDLRISTLNLAKEFTDDPVVAGGTVNLRFTFDNRSAIDATAIAFSDDLAAILPGTPDVTVVSALPMSVCGGTLTGLGASFLSFSGGSVTANTPCSFDVSVQVPLGTSDGAYINTTSALSSSLGAGDPAVDSLIVNTTALALSKAFTDDPVAPGDNVTLEFTITNLDPLSSATGISFTDDLDAALAGLAATGLPLNDVCGAGSQISGAGLVTLTGGALGAGGSCTFSVPVQVPAAAPAGAHTNVTSQVAGDIGGLAVTGVPAVDDLLVNLFTFGKAFGGPVPAGGTTTLTFTIENLDASAGAIALAFSDDLDAVVPGMVAVGLPVAEVCGPGSLLSGNSLLTLTGGQLAPGASCTFAVDVQVPLSTPEGTYVNTTSGLSQGGIPSGEPAAADIVVAPALTGVNIPTTTPVGALILVALLTAAGVCRLRWGA